VEQFLCKKLKSDSAESHFGNPTYVKFEKLMVVVELNYTLTTTISFVLLLMKVERYSTIENLNKLNMKITEHFRKRTKERTPYNDCESLLYDVNLHKESMIPLTNNSPQLRWYPWLKKELRKFPNTWIMMLESLNLALITDGMNLVTVYKLNNY